LNFFERRGAKTF